MEQKKDRRAVGVKVLPEGVEEYVRRVAKVTILGNHDAAVAGRMDYSYYYEAARRALDLHAATLSAENMEWLRQLPYMHKVSGTDVHLCHGSPVRLCPPMR